MTRARRDDDAYMRGTGRERFGISTETPYNYRSELDPVARIIKKRANKRSLLDCAALAVMLALAVACVAAVFYR